MKTPDEIKKTLEHCIKTGMACYMCRYEIRCLKVVRGKPIMQDALALIQQLEAANAEKDKRIAELEQELKAVKRERDAALSDFKAFAQCKNNICHYCAITGAVCGECGWKYPDLFVWRGVCRENTEVQDNG